MTTRPYRSPRRAAEAHETRDRIIAAAVSVLSTTDPARGFSLEAVAQEAGITRLTVYNQIGSRRALLESAFDTLAARGGLHRIPEAMADPNPHAGLDRLIAIFCDFWSGNGGAVRHLLDVAASDSELKDSLRARNERRRQALSVLVGRMVRRSDVAPDEVRDIVDVLFALTSVEFFAALKSNKRSTGRVVDLIQRLAADRVGRRKNAAK